MHHTKVDGNNTTAIQLTRRIIAEGLNMLDLIVASTSNNVKAQIIGQLKYQVQDVETLNYSYKYDGVISNTIGMNLKDNVRIFKLFQANVASSQLKTIQGIRDGLNKQYKNHKFAPFVDYANTDNYEKLDDGTYFSGVFETSQEDPTLKKYGFTCMHRNQNVYPSGIIRHTTIHLNQRDRDSELHFTDENGNHKPAVFLYKLVPTQIANLPSSSTNPPNTIIQYSMNNRSTWVHEKNGVPAHTEFGHRYHYNTLEEWEKKATDDGLLLLNQVIALYQGGVTKGGSNTIYIPPDDLFSQESQKTVQSIEKDNPEQKRFKPEQVNIEKRTIKAYVIPCATFFETVFSEALGEEYCAGVLAKLAKIDVNAPLEIDENAPRVQNVNGTTMIILPVEEKKQAGGVKTNMVAIAIGFVITVVCSLIPTPNKHYG